MSEGDPMDESLPPIPKSRTSSPSDERADIEADLTDLAQMRSIFSVQGVKGVVIACQDCGRTTSTSGSC